MKIKNNHELKSWGDSNIYEKISSFFPRVKRKMSDFLASLIYSPTFLSLASHLLPSKKRDGECINKVGCIYDLINPEFLRVYKDISIWQKEERGQVKISQICCSPENFEKIRLAYNNRESHKGKPGRSRVLKNEMIWETVWPVAYLDLKPCLRIADIGTENSCLPPYFASLGCEAYGLDLFVGGYGRYFREKILNYCYNSTLILDITGSNDSFGKAIYKTEDVTKMNIEDDFFDRITCISTIEHVLDDGAAIKEISRILKPGGILAVTIPFGFQYSQVSRTQVKGDETSFDANRVYSEEALLSRLIKPSGLSLLGDYNFSLTPSNWKKHHFLCQSPNALSVSFFLKK